ncbi:MAG: S26 family signal peptidase, partial [Sedimentisphaerales bacterium]
FQGQIFRHTAEIMGEIIAVGGQTVEIKNGFIINGKPLKQSQFPIPDWLKGIEFSTTVPDDCYFINVVYNVGGHGVKLDSSYISQICVVKKNSVKAKVFMRWQPLWTRGLLKVN